MEKPLPPNRSPKGDHNRRLSLGMDTDAFAWEAGITPEELRRYEETWPDAEFDARVAMLVGQALERLEADPPEGQMVLNGPDEPQGRGMGDHRDPAAIRGSGS